MHGLINRAIQGFLRSSYGETLWQAVARDAGLGIHAFEAMQTYDTALTEAVLDAAARRLDRPREALLEDLGNYLVSHPTLEPLRRLLRFGGVDFHDFLASLEDLDGRARLAVPDLDMPELDLAELATDRFRLTCRVPVAGGGHVVVGLLRAMADDYGALVFIDHLGAGPQGEVIDIRLHDTRFAEGKRFDLAQAGAPG
jgi:hypothetical protein